MATTMLGGKAPRPAAPRSVIEPLEALLEKPLAPLADDLGRGIESCCDLLVLQASGGIEDDLGSNDITIR
jgi:hypothetical protein